MSADAYDFASGVSALLTTESIFVAAITALIGVPVLTVISGNIPIANIPPGSYPCFVIEQGAGAPSPTTESAEYQTIGLAMTSFASDVFASLIWIDQNPESAAAARGKLPKLFAQLFMRNPQPGGVDWAGLTGWEPDRGVNHPTQIWRPKITGNYTITKN